GTTTAIRANSGSTGTNASNTPTGTTTGQASTGEQPNGQTTAAAQQAGGDQGTTTADKAASGSTGTNASDTSAGTTTGQASSGEPPNGQTTAAAQQAGGDQGTTTADKAASGSTGTNASDTSAGATTGQASTGEQPIGQTTAAAQQAGGDQGTTTADKAASGSTGTNASDTSAGTTTGQASTGEQPNGQATAQGADGRQGTATRDASTTGNPEVASASVRAAGDTAMAPEARAGNNNIRVSDAGGRAAVDGAAGTSGVSNGRDPLVQGSPSTDTGAPQATREGSHAISRAPDDVATTRGAPAGGVPDASPNGTATGAGNGREEGALIDGTASAPNTPTPEEIAFVQANELAELKQMRGAERDRQRRDSLDTRISELEQAMRAGSRTDEAGELVGQQSGQQGSTGTGTGSTSGAEPTAPVSSDISSGAPERAAIAQRPALIFDPGMSEGELVARIHPDYTADRERLQRDVDDPEERSAALHGLELMLVDSIGAETDRQLSRLERDTTDKAQVLARVDRLRRLKEDHLREADEVLASAGQRYEASESRTVEDLILLNDQPTEGSADVDRAVASPTPHNDDYVRIRTEPDMVYSSTMDHRSTEKGFSTAIRDRDRDMEVLTGLEEKIDSLETVLESMPVGRDFTKLRDRTDKLIDQHMVLRMEMGQRMEFITRSEYKAAKDSLTLLAAQNNVKGLAPSEPMAQLATSYEQEARRVMDEAAAKRKQADRIELVVVRDSLFRTTYVEELNALRLMDRAQTIRSYMQRRDFQRGERISYEEVEARMFGPVIGAPAVVAQVLDEPDTSTTGRAVVPGTEPARVEGSVEVAVNKVSVDADPANAEARAARLKAGELETASLIAADRVNTLRDSIPKARRSDRDELEREVLRQTALSDSLHRASLAAGEEAARLEQEATAAREAKAFQDRLMRYYYLDDQEMALVLNEEDRSRYFQARAKALAQQDEAARAHEQAAASKALADTIQAQSRAMLTAKDTGAAAVDAEVMRRAALLSDQAVRLNLRSDSLERVARRMELASSANAAQAATILQGLSPERGTVIMAMEQRTRRVEPVLAEARSLQAAESVQDTSGGTRDGLAQAPVRSGSRTSATDAVPVSTTEEQVVQNAGQGNVPAPSTGGIATTPTSMSTSQPSTGSADVAITPAAPALLPVLASDVFSMDVIQPRSGAIPIDAPMPSGVVYKVQIGAFRQDIPAQLFSDMTPVTGESVANGLTRYTAGMFTTPEGAVKAAETVRQRGYRDAFVVAYQDGRRVSLGQAMRAGRPTTAQVTGTISANTTASRPGTTVRIEATGTSGIVGAQGGTVAMTDSARAAEQAVLANYPASADEVLAQFAPTADATAYYNVPGAAPARQVETVKGLFFTVQVGVYSKPTALDKLFNITPLNSERTENAKIRYTTGVYVDMDKARSRKDEAVGLGVKDAFITAYLNGKRIPMRDARALINKFGTAVFADPGVITR
ncbi:MAG: hypothetical protein K1X58_16415, partial [Flavobacteriales bacterium]|nr:hypothetical protein [Flavobacteriales bacterium]